MPPGLRFSALIDQDITISAHLSGAVIEVLKGLLDIRPWARFSSETIDDIRSLEFFETFDWEVRRLALFV